MTAWVQADACVGERTAVSADGQHTSAFRLVFDCATRLWSFEVADRDVAAASGASVAATTPVAVGQWTHVAGSFDPATSKLVLYVDGTLTADATAPADWVAARGAGWDAGRIVVGRDRQSDVDGDWFDGQLADLRLYDRPLLQEDLTGGFGEPGIVEPVQVAWFGFAEGYCYDPEVVDCGVTEMTGQWNRRLQLTTGTSQTDGPNVGGALVLDTTHWIEDPEDPHYGMTTQEYGRSQLNTNPAGEPNWVDSPVLRTDESFTISTWVRLDDVSVPQTVLAQDSAVGGYSGFTIGYTPGQWQFAVRRAKTIDTDRSVASAPATDPTGWHHLVAVLDQGKRQVRLYVDGGLADAQPLHARYKPWQANGPFLVGRGTTPAGPAGWLHGAVAEIKVYQGVYTDAWVNGL
ncbi:LamG domain-containing protein [Asanoa ishikariensis]|uniref:LamG domain-containing protein n=1 Tax=Asanoa ishikariensis TaxID=137265 RepID=UPI001EF2C65C|nr:LamG domain-containing protein [Asanoa ishikariensis]